MTDTAIAIIAMIIVTADERARLGRPDAHEGIPTAGIVTRAARSTVITTTMVASAIIVKEIVIATETENASETAIAIEEVRGGKTALKGERNGEKLSVRLALEAQQ